MKMGFAGYHPAVNMLFFAGAVIFGMFFTHPFFLLVSLLMALGFYFSLKGKRGLRFLAGMSGMFAAVSLLNPVFNPGGETVLFTYLNGRHYTLEALLYGISAGIMFLTICLWFSCYNAVMTSDKFLYLFGRLAPSITLVLCMVFRFLPNMKRKSDMTDNARRCIGKAADDGSLRERLEHGMTVLSVLTSWSLEGAAMTADSMNSRGYGSGKRSSFTIYRRTGADLLVAVLLLLCMAGIILCALRGGMEVEYFPVCHAAGRGPATICGLLCYGIFLAVPLLINIWEELSWHISRSRI